ncbi:MAG: ATP synthase F0 subunit B [Bacilli bacterium]|nr:ATP synthase F0 subunit B [Bacilli bacterium]
MALDLNIYDIIIAIINFLVLYIILNKILFKPLLNHISKRNEEIKNTIEENKKLRKQLEEEKSHNQLQYDKQKKEIQESIDMAKLKLKENYQELIKNAKEKENQIYKDNITRMKQEQTKIIKENKETISNLSIEIAEKILKNTIDENKLKEMTDKFIDEAIENEK